MSLQRIRAVVAAVALLPFPAVVQAGALDELARAAERQGEVAAPLRADIEARIDGVEGEQRDSIVLVARRSPGGDGVDFAVDFEKAKLRYLVLADGSAHVAKNGSVEKVGLDAPLGGSSWVLADLRPFTIERCGVMRNVDESTRQMTILCNPEKGQKAHYILSVYKMDREKAVPERVLYYQERQDNLVKMLKNDDFELVGQKWRPTRMVMQNFKLRTKDVFEATWAQDPSFPPELFDPSSFATAKIPAAPKPTAND